MDDSFDELCGVEGMQAAFPVALSAFNGVVAILYFLAAKGQLDEDNLKTIQYGMSRSLTMHNLDAASDNELIATLRQSLERTFCDLNGYAKGRS